MLRAGDAAQKARKRATRLSLRTFQRAPNIVGETEAREPIIEMEGVRLVLPKAASHFRRLVQCSRCGGESLGEPVLSGANLGPSRLIFCDECTSRSVDLELPDPASLGYHQPLTGDEIGSDAALSRSGLEKSAPTRPNRSLKVSENSQKGPPVMRRGCVVTVSALAVVGEPCGPSCRCRPS